MEISFNIHLGDTIRKVSHKEISDYASIYGIDTIAPNRYSSLFIMNVVSLHMIQGIEPGHIIEEIRHLEGLRESLKTKPPSEFKGSVLKGLWHKHFYPALPSTIGHNIQNHLGNNGLRRLAEEVFDPRKSKKVTKEMIHEFSHKLVEGSLEQRGNKEKLTGEWIIYAKHNDKNYYLCVSPHNAEDNNILENIRVACVPEFSFLSKYVS